MKVRSPLALFGKIALGVALVAAATGAAFAAWVENGDAIFMTMIDAGLSWCM